jgi:hypothetical protein
MKRFCVTAATLLWLLNSLLHAQTDTQMIKGQNLSTANGSQIFIQWEAPSCADWTGTIVERSMSDSVWLQLAVRPNPVRCMLDTSVAWNLEYRYRISCICGSGEPETWYSEALRADEITHLDLHSYFLPQRWRTHEYEVVETQQRDSRRIDTTYHVTYRFHRAEQNIDGGEDEIFEVISQIEQGFPETTYVRFMTEFTDRIRFYSDTSLIWLGVPTIWKKRNILLPDASLLAIQDSARYIPLPTTGLTTYDTLALIFESGFYWTSDYRFRRDFGLLQAYYDISGMLSQTLHHAYSISLSSPLSVPADSPSAGSMEIVPFPNPFRSDVTINIQVERAAPVRLTVHDMPGRTVATLKDGHCDAGRYAFTFQPADLPSGMYICRLQSGSVAVSKMMLRIR